MTASNGLIDGMRIGRCLAAAAAVALLAVADGARAQLAGHGGFVKGVSVSGDGRLAATASFDYRVILWDLDDQRPLRDFDEHAGGVNAVAFLPDGRRAVSGARSGPSSRSQRSPPPSSASVSGSTCTITW